MKTGFKNELKDSEPKKIKNLWDFTQPKYDERSSFFINAGTDHGVGKNCPVGHEGDAKSEGVPMGKVKTMKTRVRIVDPLESQ